MTDHFIEALGLNAFQFGLMFRLIQRQTPFEMRLEILPDLDMPVFGQSARDTTPHDPELNPDWLFLVKLPRPGAKSAAVCSQRHSSSG